MSRSVCAVPGCVRLFHASGETDKCLGHRSGYFAITGGTRSWVDVTGSSDRATKTETYRWNDQITAPHRVDGPAVVTYDRASGCILREEWWVEGSNTRLDGPAIVNYRLDGTVASETYVVEGSASRLDGPARLAFHPSGAIAEESYLVNGHLHRIGGPAVTEYDTGGGVSLLEWWLEGENTDPVTAAEKLRSWDPARLRPELVRAGYGEVLTAEDDSLYEVVRVLGLDVRTAEGVREVLAGAPVEWVRTFEAAR